VSRLKNDEKMLEGIISEGKSINQQKLDVKDQQFPDVGNVIMPSTGPNSGNVEMVTSLP
jgi:hypothetical protein